MHLVNVFLVWYRAVPSPLLPPPSGACSGACYTRAFVLASPLVAPPMLPLVLASIVVALSRIDMWQMGSWIDMWHVGYVPYSHTLPITTFRYACTAYQHTHALKFLLSHTI